MPLFTTTAFQHRFGWTPRDKRSVVAQDLVEKVLGGLPKFKIDNPKGSPKGQRMALWDFARKVNGGKHLPTFRQEIGDCFVAGTFVPGPITKRIEDVRIGDRVYTAQGKLTSVVSVQQKLTYNQMVKVHAYGTLPLTCTSDHRFLVYRFAEIAGKRVSSNRYKSACGGKNRSNAAVIASYEAREAVWIKAGELEEGDLLLTPVDFDKIPLPELKVSLFTAGYFVGNGHASGATAEWTGPSKAPEKGERLVKELTADGFNPTLTFDPVKASWRVRVNDVGLVKWLRATFYADDNSKLYPVWALGEKTFFEGVRAADGFTANRDVVDSTSPSVVFGSMASAAMLGEDVCVAKLSRSKGTFANAKALYRIHWKNQRSRQIVWRDDKFICHPVRKIECVEGPQVVYDVGVADQHHSFLPNFVGAHNCVSMGAANVVNYLQCMQIIKEGKNQIYHPAYQPYIYGISRVQIGGGRLGNGDGSIGAWAAEGMKRYGVLRADFSGVAPYSGSVAKKWGARPGPPTNFIAEAKQYLVKTYSQVNSYEDVIEALYNGYPVTVASNRGFKMAPRVDKGKSWGIPSGSWAHQMCFPAFDDDSRRPGCYLLNSWGASAHGTPADDAPPGGFWIDADVVTAMCRQDDSFAFSQFEGFPGQELDFSLL